MSFDSRKGLSNHHGTGCVPSAVSSPGKQTLVMQLKGQDLDASAQPIAAPAGGGRALPEKVAGKMSNAFCTDFSSVRVHEGDHVSAMGAQAYAQGSEIHFAPGQYQPDSQHGQELIGHELAHVVQQSQGRVAPTTQFKGVDVNNDASLEQEADDWGARAARGESVGGAQGPSIQTGGAAMQRKVVQKKDVPTHYGTFKTTKFAKFETRGVDCVLEFHPDPDKIDAKKIGLSQTIITTGKDGSHAAIDPTKQGRSVPSGPGKDYTLDRLSEKNNPIYGADDLRSGDGLDKTKQDNNTSGDPTKVATADDGGNATYQLGYAYTDSGAKKTKEAALYDQPKGDGKFFETAALGLEGSDANKYFGSVKWGYSLKSGGGDVDIKDIELASAGVPTQDFLAPAQMWNDSKTRGTLEVVADPAKAKKPTDMSEVDVAKGTKLKQLGTYAIAGKQMVKVETIDHSKSYFMNIVDLKDTGDGGDTVNVPVPIVFVNAAELALYSDSEMKTELKKLSANTRMENTVCTTSGSYGVKIVDGADIGKTGYVDPKLIKREK